MKAVIIGAGRMGLRHIIAARDAGLEVQGISDLRPQALEEAQNLGLTAKQCFTDTASMLDATKPQLVIVSSTGPSHAPLVTLAVEKGATHILCEKPLATSVRAALDIIELCKRRNVRLATNHQMRYMEQYQAPKELAESPSLGGLTGINVCAGNMGVAMNGTHYFEMFRYMTGHGASYAQAWFDADSLPNPRGPEFLDCSGQVRLTNALGQRFFMDIGADQGHGLLVTYMCRYGHIIVDELEGVLIATYRKAEHRDLPTTRYGMPWERIEKRIAPADAVAPSTSVLKALVQDATWPDGQCGLSAVRTLVAAYVSAERGSIPVSVDDSLPVERVFPWA